MPKINVISPDGKRGTIPSEKLQQAIDAGFTQETANDKAVREYVDENKGVAGQVKTFAAQAADEFLMGVPEVALDLTQDPLERAKREALKKENYYSNLAGGLAGFAGSLAYGAPLGKIAVGAGERLATSIIEKGVGAVSQAAAKKAAESIVAKSAVRVAGGAAEGLAFAAPRAITEAALGDTDAAAETLTYGATLGGGISALIGGTAAGIRGAKKLVKEADLEPVRNWAAKTFTNVPKENIDLYLANPEAVDAAGAKGSSALRAEINEGVTAVDDALYTAQNNFNEAENAYKNNVRAARVGLEKVKSNVDFDDINRMALELDNAVLKVTENSGSALENIVSSDTTVPRTKLLGYLTQLKTQLLLPDKFGKPTIAFTDEISDAVARIDKTRANINAMSKDIDPTSAKRIIQDIDSVISRPKANGARYVDKGDRELSKFRTYVDGFLKDNKEYADAMIPVAEQSRVLGEMSKAAGTADKAKSFLKKAADPEKNPIEADLLSRFDSVFNTNFKDTVKESRRAVALLDQYRVAGTEADRKLTAGLRDSDRALLAERDAAEEALKAAKQNKKNVRGITDATSENLITRGVELKEFSIEQLISLAEQNGFPANHYVDQVKNYRAWLSFEKASTAGSRKVASFGAAGTALGTLINPGLGTAVGTAVGAITGATLDVFGGQVLKTVLKNSTKVKGILTAESAMSKAGREVSKIDVFLNDLASGKNSFPQTATVAGALRLSGDRKSKAVQLEKLSDTLSDLATNTESLTGKINLLTGELAQEGAPMVASATANNIATAVYYLQNAIPKPVSPNSVFAPKTNYIPTDAELSAFEQKLEVVQDPFAALGHFANGTLTSNHTDALNKVYPKLVKSILGKVNKIGSEKEVKPLSYKNRIKLSMLLGTPIDDTLSGVDFYQQSFQGEDKSIDQSMKGNVNIAEDAKTDVQRLA
jgi:hypothetical protein